MGLFTPRKRRPRTPQCGGRGGPWLRSGQAMLEFLVALPVLMLLFLATAEISKLFVISGKTEVASRYAALHLFRPESNPPAHPAANRYNCYLQGVFDPNDPQDISDVRIQRRLYDIFFEGVLGDPEEHDEDVRFHEFRRGDAGIFEWSDPPMANWLISVITAYYGKNKELFPLAGNRVTFEYDLPFFPHNKGASYWDFDASTGQPTWQDPDPLGPYPLYTAKGDFVMAAPTFAGESGEFVASLEDFGQNLAILLAILRAMWLLGLL